jgi:hypothetical protein
MKEDSWEECIISNSASKVTPDKAKARSLLDIAEGRINFLKTIIVKEENANYIFEGYYSSLLEIMHALAISNGYKVENHICLGYYLRDVIKDDRLFRIFDDVRVKRNRLLYYGKAMEFFVAEDSIRKITGLISEIRKLIM